MDYRTLTTLGRNRMSWIETLQTKHASLVGHVFLLHLGVSDIFLRDGRFEEMREYLCAHPPLSQAKFVAFFNRSTGIRFVSEEMEKLFRKFLEALHPAPGPNGKNMAVGEFVENRRKVGYMFKLFSEMLEIGWEDRAKHETFEKVFGKGFLEENRGRPFFAAILERLESIVPENAISSTVIQDRDSVVALLYWATRSEISRSHNLAILISENMGAVAPELSSDTNAIIPIKVPFQTLLERADVLKTLAGEFKDRELGISVKEAAQLSSGLSRRNLVQLVRETMFRGERITEDQIFGRKKQHLEERGHGMIKLLRPIWGMDAIGGLADKKAYIRRVVSAIKRSDFLSVPKGIGIFGGWGTGKTVWVEAISYESGIPFASLKNIRNMFVGESERRQDYIVELIVNYAPLFLFFDEAESQFQMRGMVFHGDTGVSARMQGRFLEFFSDTNLRGRIIPIFASNLPWLIDQAWLREGRIDDVLPFVDPDAEERGMILPAILHKLSRQAEEFGQEFRHEISDEFRERFGFMTHGHFKAGEGWSYCTPENHGTKEPETEKGFVGGELEAIIVRGVSRAREESRPLRESDVEHEIGIFLPKRDMAQFEQATDAALLHCNSLELIPPKFRERAMKLRGMAVPPSGSRGRGVNVYGNYL